VKRLRLILCLIVFPVRMVSLGRATASKAGADVVLGLTAGAFFGVVFDGVRGKWLAKVFGPDEDAEGEPAPPAAYPSADESFARLHAVGRSVGEAKVLTPAGTRWRVTGANGENLLEATGESQGEACHRAVEQAGRWGCSAALSSNDPLLRSGLLVASQPRTARGGASRLAPSCFGVPDRSA
jgi:hypothetical protein